MKKLLTTMFCFSVGMFAQSNPEMIDLGQGGVGFISKDGQYLCGSNYPNPPFLWSESTGRINVGTVEGEAYSVSNNGIVVGRFRDSSLTIGGDAVLRAGYWTNNRWTGFDGIQGVPPLDPQSFTHAYGINSEGNKAVGMVWHQNWRVEACYWSIPDTGIGLLGQTGGSNSRANVISNDGSLIAGWDGTTTGPDRRAFYWDPLPHFMGGFDPTYLVGECNGMNSDGSVIVGNSVWPFVWTSATGMKQVVADSSAYWSGSALAISDNGIMVGYVDPGGFNYRAFIKKPGWTDILYLEDFIRDTLGITSLPNWYFAFGSAISADGNRIGISAYPPGSNFSHAVMLTLNTIVPVETEANPVLQYQLDQNYPNPFNPSTTISFSIPQSTNVNLSVFNVLGERIATLINEMKAAGSYEIEFSAIGGSASGGNATNLTSGIYIYKLEAGSFNITKKMILVK
jgi:uncharacterized membrane protein